MEAVELDGRTARQDRVPGGKKKKFFRSVQVACFSFEAAFNKRSNDDWHRLVRVLTELAILEVSL